MKLRNRPLSPVQTIFVIVGVLALGIGAYELYLVASRVLHRIAVRATIPKYLQGLRTHRDQLSQAIERYHSQFGFYPPNHCTNQQNRAYVNTLFYELVGTRWDTNLHTFSLPTTKDPVEPEMIMRVFNMASFSNTLTFPSWPTNFLGGLSIGGRDENGVTMVSSTFVEGIDYEISDDFSTTPWRYAADPAEHNKGKFDLWIELNVLDQHFVIRNW